MAKNHETKERDNNDGSKHYTKHDDGWHRSYDKDDSGKKSNDHFTDHDSDKKYYSQDTDDGKHKEGDVTDKKGNNVDRPSQSDFHEKHDSACFITTATLMTLGGHDNCEELSIFRKFRDEHMTTADRISNVEKYYKIAPKIVSKIDAQSNSISIYHEIWKNSLSICLEKIKSDENDMAYETYCKMVNDLEEKYLSK